MRAILLATLTCCVTLYSVRAQCGEEPQAPYSLMNATFDRISVDADSSRHNEWRDLPLDPSQSAAFAGDLTRVIVRFRSRRVLHYSQRQIAAIRSSAHLRRGDWIVDRSGLHFVSCTERERLFQAVQRPLTERSNQALERTADRREALLPMTSTLNLEARRALVSGRSAWSR